MRTALILGTRPEIIKLSPLIKNLNKKSTSVIFTGQHYDYQMSMQFIKQLGINKPNYSMKLTRTKPSIQIAEIIKKLSQILEKDKPDTVIVQGDTNTVLAGGIAALKSNIPICHVEAGLRSYDWRMPEEHNRIVVDHISKLLFAPTQTTKNNLISEKVHGRSFVTGNTVIDAINLFSKISKKQSKLSIDIDDYALMTLHRAENVDNKNTLLAVTKAIIDSNEKVVFPVHPRTLKQLRKFDLYNKLKNAQNIHLINSVGYFEMLELMKKCSFIITDSGGLQEEATSPTIRKKVLILRKSTDRPEAVKTGFADLVGLSYRSIRTAIKSTSKNPIIPKRKSPYGEGNSSKKILSLIRKNL